MRGVIQQLSNFDNKNSQQEKATSLARESDYSYNNGGNGNRDGSPSSSSSSVPNSSPSPPPKDNTPLACNNQVSDPCS